MDILINAQSAIESISCACFGDYHNCPFKGTSGCTSYGGCDSYSFCSTKGGGNPCIVAA